MLQLGQSCGWKRKRGVRDAPSILRPDQVEGKQLSQSWPLHSHALGRANPNSSLADSFPLSTSHPHPQPVSLDTSDQCLLGTYCVCQK